MKLILNRIFICVLLLSISGMVFSIVYLTLEKFIYKITTARFMVLINTVSLFSFIIPFFLIQSIKEGTEIRLIQNDIVVFDGTSTYDGFVADILESWSIIDYTDKIWFTVAAIFLTVKIFTYLKLINNIKSKSFLMESDIWVDTFERLKNEINIHNIIILGSCYAATPFTTGMIKKYIVIPSSIINSLDSEEIEFILRHEFCHALYNDSGRKILILILNSLNWFNPLFYFLKGNLSDWMEMACDEEVTKNFDLREKRKYSKLMIKTLEIENNSKELSAYCLTYGEKSIKKIKRRIFEVMRDNRQKGFGGKLFVTTLAVCSMICGNAIAKEADVAVNKMFSKNVYINNSEEGDFMFIPMEYDEEELPTEYRSVYDSKWNLDDGVKLDEATTQIILSDDGEAIRSGIVYEERHEHIYVQGTIAKHTLHKDGSCTTVYYEAQRCSVCGYTIKGDIINTITQDVCTHK